MYQLVFYKWVSDTFQEIVSVIFSKYINIFDNMVEKHVNILVIKINMTQ